MRPLICLCVLGCFASLSPAQAQAVPVPPRAAPPNVQSPTTRDKDAFRRLGRLEAEKAKVPFDLVDAVMKIESNYDPGALGDLDEIGLMQVRPGTAAMLGFNAAEGSLATPAINIHYGTAYLGTAWRLADGNVCRALMKYRAGHGHEAMSALSAAYCARAKAHLVALNSPLAAGIGEVEAAPITALPSLAPPMPSLRQPNGRPKTGPAFWTAFQARIAKINARVEARWRRAGR